MSHAASRQRRARDLHVVERQRLVADHLVLFVPLAGGRRSRFVAPVAGKYTRSGFEMRTVRSSSGHAEERPLVHLPLILAGRPVTAEVTLSRRDEMGFRMLVGREALEQGFLVDPAHSYAGGRPRLAVRRRNRGR